MFQSTHPYRVRLTTSLTSVNNDIKFQSTHPYRVRRLPKLLSLQSLFCFNPRTHTGCDTTRRASGVRSRVSIHAPIQGATLVMISYNHLSVFQSTHPYRVRRRCPAYSHPVYGFNPRTHTGCDIPSVSAPIFSVVSIHAPIQGATIFDSRIDRRCKFQSTHPYRVRPEECPEL